MAHSKVFMLETMSKFSSEIMDLLKKEGVQIKDDHLRIPEDANILRADFIREGYNWLVEQYAGPYSQVKEVKNLLSEEIWDRYQKWGGFEEHRECVMLREALVELRKALVSRERPDFFKKTIIGKKLNAATKKRVSKA